MVKNWPEAKSIKDIQVFLCFANLYERFIKNFSRIAIPFTLMLRITGHKIYNIQAENQNVPNSASISGSNGDDRGIKNLSTIAKSAKSKKLVFV